MNTQSLRFRLIGWYACLLLGCFVLLGAATYLALRTSLVSAVSENQLRRARQIAQLLREAIEHQSQGQLGREIELRYAPDVNDRFVRISRQDGVLLYRSSAPKSQAFDPGTVPMSGWPTDTEASREIPLQEGRSLMLAAHALQMPGGVTYLVETGAPMGDVRAELRKWLYSLGAMLPMVAAVALGGGYILVKKALAPVDQISASAERMSSHNLSGRLPVARTGDELERLSIALNHMIDRLDTAFQYSRRFVADASHELRTPLTVLKGELEDLVRRSELSLDWRDRLGSALEEVERLTRIVEGLFAISRLDAGEAAAEWVKVDLCQLVSATADQMSLLAEDKRIRLTCTGTAGLWVQGDRARLKQVVVNLLDNAIKYTREGGTVALTVSPQDGKAVLEVADNGIGIPPHALPRLFERFFRVDDARSREQGGAGLGLSIVKSICAAHHGRVEASSAPGQGSCFRVELPRVPPAIDAFPKENSQEP